MGWTFASGMLALLVIGGGGTLREPQAAAQAMAAATVAEVPDERLLFGVVLNEQEQALPRVFLRRNGDLYARVSDLLEWRLRISDAFVVTVDGEAFIPLSSFPGLQASIDPARQILRMTVPADLFEATVLIAPGSQGRPLTPAAPAAFLNYDLSLEATSGNSRTAAFLEMGASGDWGLAINTMTLGDLADDSRGALRLDTYYLFDDPAHLTRLEVGDTLTRGTEWSRPIRYGGVRYGTDFGLQPNLLTFPTPVFTGRTSLPSNVELYVDDALRFRGEVDQGPFTLNQAPLVTGAGEVTLVVRDVLGVERRVTTPYYVSSRLLRPGLSDYSIEFGAERENYGIESFDYGLAFAAGSYRRGLNDRLTVEGRVEVSGDIQNVGGGFSTIWPVAGEFGLALAASNGDEGAGVMGRAYYSRVSSDWNLSISYQRANDAFAQIGVREPSERIREQLSASAGVSLGRFGAIGAAFTDIERGDHSRIQVTSANYSLSVSDFAFLNLYALRSEVRGEEEATLVGLGLTVPLGRRSSAYVQIDSDNAMAEYRRSPPTDLGWGYRATVTEGQIDRQEVEANWLGRAGQITAQAAHTDGEVAGRLLASGGMIFAGGDVHATRRVDDAFAVVETPGQANVRIYQENRLIGRTDAAGRAIITALRPYDDNRISLAVSDLPMDVRLDRDALSVVPPFRGGVIARFDIARERSGSVLLRLPDGRPVEPGTPVQADGVATFVGYDGEVFVDPLQEGAVLEVRRAEGTCRAAIPPIPPDVVLPQVGPITCLPFGDLR